MVSCSGLRKFHLLFAQYSQFIHISHPNHCGFLQWKLCSHCSQWSSSGTIDNAVFVDVENHSPQWHWNSGAPRQYIKLNRSVVFRQIQFYNICGANIHSYLILKPLFLFFFLFLSVMRWYWFREEIKPISITSLYDGDENENNLTLLFIFFFFNWTPSLNNLESHEYHFGTKIAKSRGEDYEMKMK